MKYHGALRLEYLRNCSIPPQSGTRFHLPCLRESSNSECYQMITASSDCINKNVEKSGLERLPPSLIFPSLQNAFPALQNAFPDD